MIAAYVAFGLLFTLGASLIWAINTIFLIREGGLDLFQVMLVNASFTLAQMAFEVPTGVIADTIGRRASLLSCVLILVIATLLYAYAPALGLGLWGFIAASVLLGLGYTFQTGALDAWLVDALDHTGWVGPKDRVFARGQIAAGIGMLLGSLLGGVLGQFDLVWPYLARAGLLGVCLIVAVAVVRDLGFTPRPLTLATFGAETRQIFSAGVHYGWNSRVIRPLMWASAVSGLFFFYSFYSWQPYVLQLLGRDYVWLLGIVQAAWSGAGIAGNALVGPLMGRDARLRDPARVLLWTTCINAVLAVAIGAIGFIAGAPGIVPAAVAITLWIGWGAVYGITMPVRMSYLNEHIPSSQRATVLSLDAFFLDGGAAVGQPALGWLSARTSISLAWLVGGALVGATAPLYVSSGRAAAVKLEEKEQAG